jgi:hypothetical protein
MLRSLWCLLFLLPTASMSAQSDFAYQASLDEIDQPLQRVTLPLEVILALTRADLGDIAVFNEQGKQLVHTTMRAATPVQELNRALPFHEFSYFQRQHSKTVTTREQSQQAGSLSELTTTQTVPIQTRRKDYLIELTDDASAAKFERIELQWTHEPAEQILELRIEVGNALDDLRVIKPRKSLTNLNSANRGRDDLGWRSIEGIPAGYRYLRLTPLDQITRFELQGVTGHYRESGTAAILRHRIETQRLEDGETRYYAALFPSQVNAESLRVIPAESNSLISGHLYASWDDSDTRFLVQRNFRQHNIENAEIRPSEPIKLARRPYRSIALTSPTSLSAAPAIELIYAQYELLFLGDGNGPYTLAWGNHESTGPAGDLAVIMQGSLLQAQQNAGLAALGPIGESGGLARLTPQPVLPWEKWLLWTLLILAAIVTARMALNLYREMNQSAPT